MSKFSQDELNQVLFALELMSQKIEIGYKNAIKNGTLPLDIVSNKGLHDFFIKSVNDFDRIRDILTKNNPIDMTNDEWNEITYLCILFIGDARNKGGIVNDFIMPVDHVVNVIFRKKRMEIFGSVEPPSFMNNSQKSSNSQTQTGSCYIATAVYGSYDAPQVVILRKFRDLYLHKRDWGRKFISFYYKYSPAYAKKLHVSATLKLYHIPVKK